MVPDELQCGNDWTAVVQCKQHKLIDERCRNIPGKIHDIDKTNYDQESSIKVGIVDKAYLTANLRQRWKKNRIL